MTPGWSARHSPNGACVDPFGVSADGVEAMEYLHGSGKYAGCRARFWCSRPQSSAQGRPPGPGQIKGDPALRTIPVVALTTSSARADVDACYQAGANAFVTKPLDFDEFLTVLSALKDFWFSVVTLQIVGGC